MAAELKTRQFKITSKNGEIGHLTARLEGDKVRGVELVLDDLDFANDDADAWRKIYTAIGKIYPIYPAYLLEVNSQNSPSGEFLMV